MKTTLALLAALLLAPIAGLPAVQTSNPNVIVIFCDDLGWADLGAQGIRKDILTPNLDALAKSGLLATNGYVTAPPRVPSRACSSSGSCQRR